MSDPEGKHPRSLAERTSQVDLGWSDVPAPATNDSTVELSQAELAKLVKPVGEAPADAPRELPRYESQADDGANLDDEEIDFQELHPDDATKRIAYAALLGGAQAGRGGPRRGLVPTPNASDEQMHEQPTLVGRPLLSEEAARKLVGEDAGFVVPEIEESAPTEPPLPSFDQDLAFDAFEPAEPLPEVTPAEQAPPRPRLRSDPLPRLGFDDSDLTVRAVVKMPPEMFRDQDGTPSAPVIEEIAPRPAAGRRPSVPPQAPPLRPAPGAVSRSTLEAAASAFAAAEEEPEQVVLKAPVAPSAARRPSSPFEEPVLKAPVARSVSESPLPVANALTAPGLHTREPPGFVGVMGQRFRFLGAHLPIWFLWLLPTAMAGFAVVMSVIKMRPSTQVVAPAPLVTQAAPPAASVSLDDRARAGDPSAIEQLSRLPEAQRSVAAAVALAKGKSAIEVKKFDELRQKLQRQPKALDNEATKQKLLEYVLDPRTVPDALAAISELPGPEGPDLLYEIWTGTKETNETTQLARELLHKQVVLAKASESLKVALELRAEPSCEEVRSLLPRAETSGDWRSLHLLGRLLSRRGCGEDERRDCYRCLRSESGERAIGEAIKAVRSRPRPKP